MHINEHPLAHQALLHISYGLFQGLFRLNMPYIVFEVLSDPRDTSNHFPRCLASLGQLPFREKVLHVSVDIMISRTRHFIRLTTITSISRDGMIFCSELVQTLIPGVPTVLPFNDLVV
jgi:hypothetical protein